MSIIEKIKLRITNKRVRQYRIFNIPFLEVTTDLKTRKKTFRNLLLNTPRPYNINCRSNAPLFYLKMNRTFGYAFPCLQHWINIVNELDADFYIICDKPELEKDILKYIEFKNSNIKFMKSNVDATKKIAHTVATKGWWKAAYAHLTTFFHAKENNIQNFWNIDADDAMFIADPKTSAEILKAAEKYAENAKMDAFSFDMWNSRTNKKTWSFGITYTRMQTDWFKLFNENKDFAWTNKYQEYAYEWNLDYFMTHLRDTHRINVGHFYCENLSFIHWGDFVINIITSSICKFKDGRVIYPILNDVMNCPAIGNIPIADDDIKLDLNIDNNSCDKFALSFITNLRIYNEQTQKLWCIETVCQNLDRSY